MRNSPSPTPEKKHHLYDITNSFVMCKLIIRSKTFTLEKIQILIFFYSFLPLLSPVLFILLYFLSMFLLSTYLRSIFRSSSSPFLFIRFLSFLSSPHRLLSFSTFYSAVSLSSLFLPSSQTSFLRRQLLALFPPLTVLSSKALISLYDLFI